MTQQSTLDLHRMFQPRSVAIIGASRDEWKSGAMFINSMLRDGYAGIIYPINRKETEIMGLKCYPSVVDIPDEVDMAVLAIPAQAIVPAMEDCVKKGVKFAIVHAVGFSELGEEGKELEKKMVSVARQGNIRLIGPNCMGIFTSRGRINTIVPYAKVPMDPGGAAFVGQSGWVSESMVRLGSGRGLRFTGVISIGNQSDLTVEDLFEYWGNDPDTKVIAAYIEGLKNPQRFMEVARKITPHKPIIVWKGGSSEMGARAAASHTGSLAGSYQIFQTMCRQTGVIPAAGMEDVVDLAVAFSSPVLPRGNEVGLLIEAGGGAVASSDACAREGLKISPLPPDIQHSIVEYLKDRVPPSNNRKNPVDLVWAPVIGGSQYYVDCLEMMLPAVDVCLVITYAFLHEDWFRQKMVELRDRLQKPIVLVAANPDDQVEGMALATRDGLPCYMMPDNAVRCVSAMVKRAKYLRELP